MCGIAGFIESKIKIEKKTLYSMLSKLNARGPDDQGCWIQKNIAIGHTRLAILDSSDAGKQPMISKCGRYILSYNGEIYNHLQIRAKIEEEYSNFNWQGGSDTETLLESIVCWGFEKSLEMINGMFAFALWDRSLNQLVLARDRIGEKPIYYGQSLGTFFFASDSNAIREHPSFKAEIDRDVLSLYMQYACVPSPYSIYKGLKKLESAHYVLISNQGQDISEPICYWSLNSLKSQGVLNVKPNQNDLLDSLDVLLRDSVGMRMLSDVPLGAFLSGGFDSAMIVSQMQAQSMEPVKTYSIGNFNDDYNEAHYASLIAKHLGTDHTELYVSDEDAINVIYKLPFIYDEPFADSSQIPTYLVSKLARNDVTVALSGDGGDELFGGYNRYIFGPKLWRSLNRLPLSLQRILGTYLDKASSTQKIQWVNKALSLSSIPSLSIKLSKVSKALGAKDDVNFYNLLRTHWREDEEIVLGVKNSYSIFNEKLPQNFSGLLEKMIYLDLNSYLPDDILTKVDRASMASSLEARAPFLDHRLVEFAWNLPSEFKIKNGQGKWIIKELMNRYVPRHLMDRPKQGFGVPIGDWLRGPLRDWAESLLNEKRLAQEGYFDASKVRKVWQNHLIGIGHREQDLWCVLMFQSWFENLNNR
jgi:asparagine synthase (glutamine-hydrolysing)